MSRAYLFDFDNVVARTELFKAIGWEVALDRYGVPGGADWYKARIGGTNLPALAIEQFNLSVSPDVLHEQKERAYVEAMGDQVTAIPATIAFIKRLRSAGKLIGLVTSQYRPIVREQLVTLNLRLYFDEIVTGSDVRRNKPDPEGYLLCAKWLRRAPDSCCGIEDSDTGITAVKSAGMSCIGFRNPESGSQTLAGADLVTSDFEDVPID